MDTLTIILIAAFFIIMGVGRYDSKCKCTNGASDKYSVMDCNYLSADQEYCTECKDEFYLNGKKCEICKCLNGVVDKAKCRADKKEQACDESKCDVGYHYDNNECKKNVCKCTGGTVQTGTCATHDSEDCKSCKVEQSTAPHELVGKKCVACLSTQTLVDNKCTDCACLNGVVDNAKCWADNKAQACDETKCEPGYRYDTNECKINECKCHGADKPDAICTDATKFLCTVDDCVATYVAGGHLEVEANSICDGFAPIFAKGCPTLCGTETGTPKDPCIIHNDTTCASCYEGFHLDTSGNCTMDIPSN